MSIAKAYICVYIYITFIYVDINTFTIDSFTYGCASFTSDRQQFHGKIHIMKKLSIGFQLYLSHELFEVPSCRHAHSSLDFQLLDSLVDD